MTAYVMFENKKTDRIVNIDKEKNEIYSLHVNSCYVNMQGNDCSTAFEKSIPIDCTLTILIICKNKIK